MNRAHDGAPRPSPGSNLSFRSFLWVAIGLTAIRVAGLLATPLDLHPDEAQYWVWSRTLDWGYFSKPPLVAWTIRATTAVFGDAPWAVRLAAPLLHLGAAGALFALARRLYGPGAGWWAGVGWLLIPGVWLSASLITTDALLLPAWACALYVAWRWIETRSWAWAAGTGALIGVGMLAKYAMLFFPAGLALAALVSADVRRAVLAPQTLAAIAVAAAVVAPNLWWNATHNFETLSHTAANADWKGDLFNLDQLAAFVGDQFAVAGVMAGALIVSLVAVARHRGAFDGRARFLVAMLAPPLVFMIVQALISRAHGNWAATAYPAAIVFIAGQLAGSRLLRWGTGAHAALYALFLALALNPGAAYRAPLVGRAIENGLKRMNAWDRTAAAVAAEAQQGRYTAVLVDHRHMYCELAYHWRDRRDLPPLRMYVLRDAAGNQAEAAAPMRAALGAHVLVVHMSPRYEHFVAGDFHSFHTFRRIEIPLGPHKTRAIAFSEASGFAPIARTSAFLEEVGD